MTKTRKFIEAKMLIEEDLIRETWDENNVN